MITGSSGAGKTRLAATLSARLGIPHIELDGIYQGPNWTHPSPAEFRTRVAELASGPSWVIDGNYTVISDVVRARAELLVALDLSRPVVLTRLLHRTATRMLTGAELWNGNREDWRNLLTYDPELNILLWSHQNFGRLRRRAREDERAGRSGGLPAVRLTSRAQVVRFIDYLTDLGR